jgi:hypothetical protein
MNGHSFRATDITKRKRQVKRKEEEGTQKTEDRRRKAGDRDWNNGILEYWGKKNTEKESKAITKIPFEPFD